MGTVHLLWHVHEISPDKTDDKLIGVYTTKANAMSAILRLRGKAGFKENPDQFQISEYTLDVDNWAEGYSPI
jgi:hypothetical protein